MDNNLINEAVAYVKALFQNDFGGHDFFHTMRVYETATKIAEREGANLRLVQLAALLHDADDVKLSPDTYINKERAVSFLRRHNLAESEIKSVCTIIEEVAFRGTDSVAPTTIEGMCVQDADRLDAIGAIGIARAFAYGGSHNRTMYDPNEPPRLQMSEEEYRAHVSTTVNHFYEKLFLLKDMMHTATARSLAEQREEYMRLFLKEFFDEWNGLR